jgi:hypothetical protein
MRLDETCSKVCIGKHLFDAFPTQNALLPLLFNFSVDYAISKIQENVERLELNGTHQLLIFTDNVNLLG